MGTIKIDIFIILEKVISRKRLTHYPDLWAAGVNIVGIFHFKSFLENTGPWRRKLRECEYGCLGIDDFFEEIAPFNLFGENSSTVTRVPWQKRHESDCQ